MKKISLLLSHLLIPSYLYAQSPSANQLQMEYQDSLHDTGFIQHSLTSVYQISETTFYYLNDAFDDFYQTISFTTPIKDSTFDESKHYELVSVPLLSSDTHFIQLEIFGKLSNPNSAYLSNMTSDHTLYEHFGNSEVLDIYHCDVALGAGISFQTSSSTKIKILISNKNLPGYGDSNALIGFESQF